MQIDEKEYETGAAAARALLGKSEPAAEASAPSALERQRFLSNPHAGAQQVNGGGQEHPDQPEPATNSAERVDAAATPEERGAAIARSMGLGPST